MKPVDELVAAMVACLTDDLHELFQERAAIRQHDGGQSRELSEAMAVLPSSTVNPVFSRFRLSDLNKIKHLLLMF